MNRKHEGASLSLLGQDGGGIGMDKIGTGFRGVRYIDEKLSKADKSVFLKLSATYRYRKMEIWKLSKTYRYRKMHQIWSDKYMKSQSIRN